MVINFSYLIWRSLIFLAVYAAPCQAALVLSQGTNLNADVSAINGQIAIDLLGNIWSVPANGGQAKILSNHLLPASRPRWSLDGTHILHQTQTSNKSQVWIIDLKSTKSSKISDGMYFDQQPEWHPDGERIIFSSVRGATGFDIWEMHLPTGRAWKASNHPGDETEPVWSADGQHLAYIQHYDNRWSLILRRNGQPEHEIVVSTEPLSAPSWRPDGSLLTFLRKTDSGLSVEMVILSNPPLIRQFITGEDFFISPISWLDRKRFFYTSDGIIKTRNFDDRQAKSVVFYATVGRSNLLSDQLTKKKKLPLINPPNTRLVIRAAGVFDGTGNEYKHKLDVLIDGPRIAALTTRRDWPDATVLDVGNVMILPGFIDSYSSLSSRNQANHGAELLSYGVTTLITSDYRPDYNPLLWEGEETPGPRLLWAGDIALNKSDDGKNFQFVTIPSSDLNHTDQRSAVYEWQAKGIPILAESWSVGLSVSADLLLGAITLPTSPKGIRYQDITDTITSGSIALVSGLADAGTPGLSALFRSRQSKYLQQRNLTLKPFSSISDFSGTVSSIIIGSKPNGLPPGLALHAEIRALTAAGLSNDQVLRATGVNPAKILGLENQIGRIVEGALADMVLVSGDPLNNITDTMNIIAVVRTGRFYSLASLMERARNTLHVE